MVTAKQLERITRAKSNLEVDRAIFISRWKEIARQMLSSYGSWGKSADTQKNLDDTASNFDNTANQASNLMADGLMGSCFGRNIAWFSLLFEKDDWNKDKSAAEWLYNQERIVYRQFDRSNFYDEARSFVRLGGDFGTATMFMQEHPEEGKPFFRTLHPKDVVLMENRFGVVDTMIRDIYLTKDDAIKEFGEKKLPETIRTNEDYTKKFIFHQYIGPNYRFELNVKGTDEYISIYWSDEDATKTLKEERFPRKPFVAWRWNRDLEGCVYGTQSPGLMQISNMKSVNNLTENVQKQSQLIVEPPIKATEGLVVNFRPRGLNSLKNGEDFAPVNITGDLTFTENERNYIRQSIRQAYYSDFFLLLSQNLDKTKTATEVAGIMNEQSNVMSSFFNRLATEFLEPVIEFVFENEMTHGRLEAIPENSTFSGEEIKVDFVSPMFLIQKRSHTVDGIVQAAAQILQFAQVKPEIIDKLRFDNIADVIADGWNVKKVLIEEDHKVAEIREKRAQIQAAMADQQMQNETGKAQAQIYDQLGKAPESGSAMAQEEQSA